MFSLTENKKRRMHAAGYTFLGSCSSSIEIIPPKKPNKTFNNSTREELHSEPEGGWGKGLSCG